MQRVATCECYNRRADTILETIRVVELAEALAGPYCAMLLGDVGADVIKVERPGIGDQSIAWGPPYVGNESDCYLLPLAAPAPR
jgi:crotonobetainyl-CoA:carnitine CoA-transferase CaiB-like acyl-CoA transferase